MAKGKKKDKDKKKGKVKDKSAKLELKIDVKPSKSKSDKKSDKKHDAVPETQRATVSEVAPAAKPATPTRPTAKTSSGYVPKHSMGSHGKATSKPKTIFDMEPMNFKMPTEESLFSLANLFKIFADPTRLKILYSLVEGPKCVADIARAAGVTQGATSHQLRSMKQERLVDFVRDGKQVIYSLADDRVQTLLAQGYSYISD